jgi:hypothetical protein
MAGHAGDVIATEEQVRLAREAVLTQLRASGVAKNHESFAEAMHDMGLWEFVEIQARVIAQHWAFEARDNAIINKLTMAGAYVKLDIDVEE